MTGHDLLVYSSAMLRSLARSSRCRTLKCRSFSHSTLRYTDGVFRALTESRVQIPWIDAFLDREQSEKIGETTESTGRPIAAVAERDVKPRPMSESFHKVIPVETR